MSSATRVPCGLVLAFITATAAAPAQAVREHFGLGGSVIIPTGDFHSDASGAGFKVGWQGMVFVDVERPGSPIGFRVDGNVGENIGNDQLNADLSAALGRPTTAKIKLRGGNADVKYHIRPSVGGVQGYLLAGMGVYNVKLAFNSQGVTGDSSETKVAWNVGAGLAHRVGDAALFVEARYLTVALAFGAVRTTFVPITAGVRFGLRP